MKAHTDQIARAFFNVPSLNEVSAEQLHELVKDFPCFHIAHFLLSRKLRDADGVDYESASRLTGLYFHNPFWLQWLLQDQIPQKSVPGGTDGLFPGIGGPGSLQSLSPAGAAEGHPYMKRVLPSQESSPLPAPPPEPAEMDREEFREPEQTPREAAKEPPEPTYLTAAAQPTPTHENAATESPLPLEAATANLLVPPADPDVQRDEELRQVQVEELEPEQSEPAPVETAAPALFEPALSLDDRTIPENSTDEISVGTEEEIRTEPAFSDSATHPEETSPGEEKPAENSALTEWESKSPPSLDTVQPDQTEAQFAESVVPIAAQAFAPERPILPALPEGEAIAFDPYHTIDYFASQGIKLVLEEHPTDKFGQQLKSFTDWLKVLKRVPAKKMAEELVDEPADPAIAHFAAKSLEDRETITETMAQVLLQQGKFEKAAEIYQKLALRVPEKSAYFAALAENTKKQGQ
jgi:hypothetical protein